MNQDYDKIAAMRVALALDALHTEGLSDAERIEAAMEVMTSTIDDQRAPCEHVIYDDHKCIIRPCGAPGYTRDNALSVCLFHASPAATATRRELAALGITAPLTLADWRVLKPLLAGECVAMPPPRATRLRKLLIAWSRDGRAHRCILPTRTGTYRWNDNGPRLGLPRHATST